MVSPCSDNQDSSKTRKALDYLCFRCVVRDWSWRFVCKYLLVEALPVNNVNNGIFSERVTDVWIHQLKSFLSTTFVSIGNYNGPRKTGMWKQKKIQKVSNIDASTRNLLRASHRWVTSCGAKRFSQLIASRSNARPAKSRNLVSSLLTTRSD